MALALAPAILRAIDPQTPSPLQIEVASVKPNKSGSMNATMETQPGGRYVVTNVSLRLLITTAYGLTDSELVGGPAWVSGERFDITAKGEGELQSISS